MCTHGHPHIPSHRPIKTSSHCAVHIHVSPILTCCVVENPRKWCPVFHFSARHQFNSAQVIQIVWSFCCPVLSIRQISPEILKSSHWLCVLQILVSSSATSSSSHVPALAVRSLHHLTVPCSSLYLLQAVKKLRPSSYEPFHAPKVRFFALHFSNIFLQRVRRLRKKSSSKNEEPECMQSQDKPTWKKRRQTHLPSRNTA